MKNGLIHIYCGDGKGKTTTSIGIAVRAIGHGMKVVFLQFLKGSQVSEMEGMKHLPNLTILRNPKDLGFYHKMTEETKEEITMYHNQNLKKALKLVEENQCDVLILDELLDAYRHHLVDRGIIDEMIHRKKDGLELVFTGRDPEDIFIENADYISEIRKIKHPFDQKIRARKGIEY